MLRNSLHFVISLSVLVACGPSDNSVTPGVGSLGAGANNAPPNAGNPISETILEDSPRLTVNLAKEVTDVEGDTLTYAITSISPIDADVVVDLVSGILIYSPTENFNGHVTVLYEVSDKFKSSPNTVDVEVTAVNDAPTAPSIDVEIDEDGGIQLIDLLAFDVDGDEITLDEITIHPLHGTLYISPDLTSAQYMPDPDFFGADSFEYKISDPDGRTDTGEVSIEVGNQNDAPVAYPAEKNIDEDSIGQTLDLANFVQHPDAVNLDYSIDANGLNAVVNGSIVTFSPDKDFNGDVDFTYAVSDQDPTPEISSNSVTFHVAPINDDPIAYPGLLALDEDSANSINLAHLSYDIEGDDLSISLSGFPANGDLVNRGATIYEYTPNPDYYGTDSFTYAIDDGNGGNAEGIVTITVDPINDDPIAENGPMVLDEDTVSSVDLAALISDADDDNLSISISGFPVNGDLVTISATIYEYTPNPNYEGSDLFKYTVDDGNGGNDEGTVGITVDPVNDAPTASSGTADVDEDDSVSTDVVALGSDVDLSDTLILSEVTPGANGVVTINGDLAVYTPNADFNGTDSYTFTLQDSGLLTVIETVHVTIKPINDAPRDGDFSDSVEEDAPFTIDLALGTGATDIEGDTISLSDFDTVSAEGGTIVFVSGNSVTYTPAADFNGTDTFKFVLTDSQPENAESDPFTITMTVTPVADAPVANDDSFDDPIEALNFWRYSGPMDITDDVLANDTDADDGDVLVVDEIDVTSTTGNVILDADVLTYEPAEVAFDIIDTFDYDVSDGDVSTLNDTATVTVDIAPNNSVKYMGQVGVLQSTRSLSKADVDGYAVIVDVPGEYASVMRISDVDPSNLGNIVWEVSLETPANPTVALLVDAEVASNSSNEAVVAAIYSFHPDAVLVTGINSDGSLGFSVVLAQASGLSATIGIEGLALDGLGGCIVGLRLDDGTLRITHLDADGLILDSQVVDPSFGTINSISNIAGDYYLAMSTGILKLDSSLLGVYHFGNTGSPININSVRPHAIAGIVVAGSNGYLALIDDITAPATPTVFWAKDISGATLETVEFNDLVSNTDGNVYVVGETSDNRPTFYSVAGGSGAQNFVMRTYSSPWDSAEFNTLTQSDVALDQSLVGSMSVGTDSNFFRFEASNIGGFPVITCSPDGHGIANSGFLTSPSVLVMSVTAIVDVVDTDISGDPGPVTSETTSLFRRRANL